MIKKYSKTTHNSLGQFKRGIERMRKEAAQNAVDLLNAAEATPVDVEVAA